MGQRKTPRSKKNKIVNVYSKMNYYFKDGFKMDKDYLVKDRLLSHEIEESIE